MILFNLILEINNFYFWTLPPLSIIFLIQITRFVEIPKIGVCMTKNSIIEAESLLVELFSQDWQQKIDSGVWIRETVEDHKAFPRSFNEYHHTACQRENGDLIRWGPYLQAIILH